MAAPSISTSNHASVESFTASEAPVKLARISVPDHSKDAPLGSESSVRPATWNSSGSHGLAASARAPESAADPASYRMTRVDGVPRIHLGARIGPRPRVDPKGRVAGSRVFGLAPVSQELGDPLAASRRGEGECRCREPKVHSTFLGRRSENTCSVFCATPQGRSASWSAAPTPGTSISGAGGGR